MMLLDVFTFFGRLHPLIVHLPIGFLLLAVVFDMVSYIKRYAYLKEAVSFTLLLGFIAAVLACIFGYMLSLTGDYDYETLTTHKISGILLAVIAGVLYLLTTKKLRGYVIVPSKLFSVFILGLVVLMSYAGHQGGNLTHGSDYLNLATLTAEKREKPVSVEEAYIFEDVVHPILVTRCGQCHQAGKLKGKLSVQTLQSLLKGGKTGPAVTAGNLGESELFKRVTLDPKDEKFMPTDGKTPLTKNETAIIKWWIEKAMATEGKKMAVLKDAEVIKPQVASFLGMGGDESLSESASGIVQNINPDIPVKLDTSLVENLRKKGFTVRIMLKKPVMLDVTLPANSGKKMAGIKDDLLRVAKNIVWLNLSGNGFTDTDLNFLNQVTNLEKLRLEKNPVSDAISGQLIGLKHLEALNLNETKLTAAGIEKLKANPAIKRIYTWETAVK